MVPSGQPAVSWIRTVTASAGSVCRTVPDQVPASALGIFGVAVGEAVAVAGADLLACPSVAAAAGVGCGPCWVTISVVAMAMAATQAAQAAMNAARRGADPGGASASSC